MPDLKNYELEAVWKLGVPMASASVRFAPSGQKQRHTELHDTSIMGLASSAAEKVSEAGLSINDRMTASLEAMQSLAIARNELLTTMKENVLRWVQERKLHAFAFDVPRSLTTVPVAVPLPAWRGRLDWDKSQIAHHGLQLSEVRILPSDALRSVLDRCQPVSRGRGRPSVAPIIKGCIEQLVSEAKIDASSSITAHYPMIHDRLELDPAFKKAGFSQVSDETIRKVLSPIYKELPKTKKQ